MTADVPDPGSPVTARRVLALSASAFGVLAAEPLFVLVDTAVVGHLGALPLGALGLGGTLLSLVALVGAFLEYGTTGRAARHFGAGQRGRAVDEGVAATLLALVLGALAVVAGEALAGPLVSLLAGSGPVREQAEAWFRVALLGLPAVLVVLAGNGWMRGVQDTRRPLLVVVVANAVSAAASPLLVYGAGLGLVGSAVANVAGQVLGAVLFTAALRAERRGWRPCWPVVRAQLVTGRDLVLRAVAFEAAFLVAAGVAARMGTAQVAAHQVGLQVWTFTSLVLDSFAIAAQSLVGAALGSGDVRAARATARQVARWGLAAGVVAAALLSAGWVLVPEAFTSSAAVRHQAHLLWPFLAGMEPAAGVVFALDGVLVGAGDVAFLRTITLVGALGAFVPLSVCALELGWGITGVWAALTAFIVVRLVGMLARTSGTRWLAAQPGTTSAAGTASHPAGGHAPPHVGRAREARARHGPEE